MLGCSNSAQALDIESPSFRYEPAKKSYIFEDARLQEGNWTIFSPLLEVNEERNTAKAKGLILFNYGDLEGSAQQMVLRFNPLQGEFKDLAIYDPKDGLQIRAKHAELNSDGEFKLYNCDLTSCPNPLFAWKVKAERVNISGNGLVSTVNSSLHVLSLPVLWFPWFSFPTGNQRLSGFLLPEIKNKSSLEESLHLGWYTKIPYFQTLGPSQDITIAPEFFENKPNGIGLEYRYAWQMDQRGHLTRHEYQGTRNWTDFEHNQGWQQKNRLTLNYAHSSDGLVRHQYGNQLNYRPWKAWQAGFSQQLDKFDWSIAGYHHSQLQDESKHPRSPADSNEKAQLAPRLRLQGARQWSFFPRARFQFSWQGEYLRFNAPKALSGRVIALQPQLEWAQGLGPINSRFLVHRHQVSYADLEQYQPEYQPEYQQALPSRDFHQDALEVEFRLPLEARFFASPKRSGLIHRLTPALGFQWREEVHLETSHEDHPISYPLIAKKSYTLLLKNNWSWGNNSGYLNLLQRYDTLRENKENSLEGINTSSEVQPPSTISDSIIAPEGNSQAPLLPLITQLGLQFAGFNLNSKTRYDHQRRETSQAEVRLSQLSSGSNSSLGWHFNRRDYQKEDFSWNIKSENVNFNFQFTLARFLTSGWQARWDLEPTVRPAERALQYSGLFLEFSPICYRLRISLIEEVVSQKEDDEIRYVVENKTSLSLRLFGW